MVSRIIIFAFAFCVYNLSSVFGFLYNGEFYGYGNGDGCGAQQQSNKADKIIGYIPSNDYRNKCCHSLSSCNNNYPSQCYNCCKENNVPINDYKKGCPPACCCEYCKNTINIPTEAAAADKDCSSCQQPTPCNENVQRSSSSYFDSACQLKFQFRFIIKHAIFSPKESNSNSDSNSVESEEQTEVVKKIPDMVNACPCRSCLLPQQQQQHTNLRKILPYSQPQ